VEDTRHRQVALYINPPIDDFVLVDEDLRSVLRWLNNHKMHTMFSCQGDEEQPFGYISFSPGVVFLDKTRRVVESLLGIKKKLPIIDTSFGDLSLVGQRHWQPPRDGRPFGGRLHGWCIYFAFLQADDTWDRQFECEMCGGPLSVDDEFSYHEACAH
jgi:hypothetical protein